jgi:hypothetical protein
VMAWPYWLRPARSQAITPGGPVVVVNAGVAAASLKVVITAGAAPVVNPRILSAAGLSTWTGSVPAGQTLIVDASPGVWSVALNGLNVKAQLSGPQPALGLGAQSVTVTAPGAQASLSWQESVR